jgi:capsular exopolysaccharide synthesis family protein
MSKFSKALEQAQRDRALRLRPAPAPPENGQPAEVRPEPAPAPPENGQTAWARPAPPPPPRTAKPVPRRRRPVGPTEAVDDHLVSLVAPSSLEAEQYRALRHVVEQKRRAENMSVIAISSPGGGDGKTTTAINLAGALAQAPDARVLLIEADLRRPSIGPLLGMADPNALGLVHAILDPGLSLADIVQPLPTFNLGVVVAGQTPPSPYEVLKSPRVAELLDEARRDYDFVILDTAPLVPVQDYRVIARLVDGMVLVVAAHRTPRPMLEAAFEILDPARMIGLVFNGYDHLLSGRNVGYEGGYYAPRSGHRGAAAKGPGNRLGRLLRRGSGSRTRSRRPGDSEQ